MIYATVPPWEIGPPEELDDVWLEAFIDSEDDWDDLIWRTEGGEYAEEEK